MKADFMRKIIILLFLCITMLVACGGSSDDEAPPPTITPIPPTPRSTPLPPAPTAEIFGTEQQPIRLVFVADGSSIDDALEAVSEAMNTDFTNERLAALGLEPSVMVENVENMAAALEAVCVDNDAVAWVDAFTYVAAKQRCDARPLLAVRRNVELQGLPTGVDITSVTGIDFEVYYDMSLRPFPTELAGLNGFTVCRLNATDEVSSIYFGLALRAAGINPVTDIAAFVDTRTYSDMLETIALPVADGGCDVGAIPTGTFDEIFAETDLSEPEDEDADPVDPTTIFGEIENADSWPTIPHDILIAPAEERLNEDLVETVVDQFQDVREDEALEDAFDDLLPHTTISVIRFSDLLDFETWLEASGWAMGR